MRDLGQDQRGTASRNELLGPAATEFIDRLEADRRVPEHAWDVLKARDEEIELGLACPYETRAQLDRRFGAGQWRPLPRHAVYQANKARPIDDGRRAGHNQAALLSETIVCQTGEFIPLAAKQMIQNVMELTGFDPHDGEEFIAA